MERNCIKVVSKASTMDNLMYAMLCDRPDIYFVVGIVSGYWSIYWLKLWTNVKHILWYLWRIRIYMFVSFCDELVLLRIGKLDFSLIRTLVGLPLGMCTLCKWFFCCFYINKGSLLAYG